MSCPKVEFCWRVLTATMFSEPSRLVMLRQAAESILIVCCRSLPSLPYLLLTVIYLSVVVVRSWLRRPSILILERWLVTARLPEASRETVRVVLRPYQLRTVAVTLPSSLVLASSLFIARLAIRLTFAECAMSCRPCPTCFPAHLVPPQTFLPVPRAACVATLLTMPPKGEPIGLMLKPPLENDLANSLA